MKLLDSAVVLTNLRDDLKNQIYAVEEAELVLEQSMFEPPATQRKAEMNVNKNKRALEQKKRSYQLREAQNIRQISHMRLFIERKTRTVNDLQEYLDQFTIIAPSDGMLTYKKERNGYKRKAGSVVNPFDMIIATLPDLSSMVSKIYVSEIDVNKVINDQKVNVTVDAFPEKSFTGKVISVANIGEQLPNSDAKMFEVQIKVDGNDPALRPSMTTGNKIIIKSFDDVVFIPTECVQTGSDSVPFVYAKNRTKQIVVLGESNDKNVIVLKGLEPGSDIYRFEPEEHASFKLVGANLVSSAREN